MSKKLRMKLRCDQVSNFVYGQVVGLKHVNPIPVEKGKKEHENSGFAKEVPAATLEMQINLESSLYNTMVPGGEYYFEITAAEVTKKEA